MTEPTKPPLASKQPELKKPAAVPVSEPPLTRAERQLLASFAATNAYGRQFLTEIAAGIAIEFPAQAARPPLHLIKSGGLR
jgi:hypothetical protein